MVQSNGGGPELHEHVAQLERVLLEQRPAVNRWSLAQGSCGDRLRIAVFTPCARCTLVVCPTRHCYHSCCSSVIHRTAVYVLSSCLNVHEPPTPPLICKSRFAQRTRSRSKSRGLWALSRICWTSTRTMLSLWWRRTSSFASRRRTLCKRRGATSESEGEEEEGRGGG